MQQHFWSSGFNRPAEFAAYLSCLGRDDGILPFRAFPKYPADILKSSWHLLFSRGGGAPFSQALFTYFLIPHFLRNSILILVVEELQESISLRFIKPGRNGFGRNRLWLTSEQRECYGRREGQGEQEIFVIVTRNTLLRDAEKIILFSMLITIKNTHKPINILLIISSNTTLHT